MASLYCLKLCDSSVRRDTTPKANFLPLGTFCNHKCACVGVLYSKDDGTSVVSKSESKRVVLYG